MIAFGKIFKEINKKNILLRKIAALSDVAPTILQLMEFPVPHIMSGISLIKELLL